MGLNVLQDAVIQTRGIFAGCRMFCLIDSPVDVEHQIVHAELDLGSFSKTVRMDLLDQPENLCGKRIESHDIIVINKMMGILCMFDQINIVFGQFFQFLTVILTDPENKTLIGKCFPHTGHMVVNTRGMKTISPGFRW